MTTLESALAGIEQRAAMFAIPVVKNDIDHLLAVIAKLRDQREDWMRACIRSCEWRSNKAKDDDALAAILANGREGL